MEFDFKRQSSESLCLFAVWVSGQERIPRLSLILGSILTPIPMEVTRQRVLPIVVKSTFLIYRKLMVKSGFKDERFTSPESLCPFATQ
jgi:hypothetical protein